MVMGESIAETCSEMHEKWKKYFLDIDAVSAVAHIFGSTLQVSLHESSTQK